MQTRLVKRAVIQISTAIVTLVLTFFVYVFWASSRGEQSATNACASLPVGMPFPEAVAIVTRMDVKPQLRFMSNDEISVGFEGALMDRWFCNVSAVDGKVA